MTRTFRSWAASGSSRAAPCLLAAILLLLPVAASGLPRTQRLDVFLLIDYSFPPRDGIDDRESLLATVHEALASLKARAAAGSDHVRVLPFAKRISDLPLLKPEAGGQLFTPSNIRALIDNSLPLRNQRGDPQYDVGDPNFTDFVSVLRSFVDAPPKAVSRDHLPVILIISNAIDDPDNTRGCHEPILELDGNEWRKQVSRRQQLLSVVNALPMRAVLLAVPCRRLPQSSRAYGIYPFVSLWADARRDVFEVVPSWPSFPSNRQRSLRQAVDEAVDELQPLVFLEAPEAATVTGTTARVTFKFPGRIRRTLDAVVCLEAPPGQGALEAGNHIFFGPSTAPARCRDVKLERRGPEEIVAEIDLGFHPLGSAQHSQLGRQADLAFTFTFDRHTASAIAEKDWPLLVSPTKVPAMLQYRFPVVPVGPLKLGLSFLYHPVVTVAFVAGAWVSILLLILAWLHRAFGWCPSAWNVTWRGHSDPSPENQPTHPAPPPSSAAEPLPVSRWWSARHTLELSSLERLQFWPLGAGSLAVLSPAGTAHRLQRLRTGESQYSEIPAGERHVIPDSECSESTPLRVTRTDPNPIIGVSLACTPRPGVVATFLRWTLSGGEPRARRVKWGVLLTSIGYFGIATVIVYTFHMDDQWSGFYVIPALFPVARLGFYIIRRLRKVEHLEHRAMTVWHSVAGFFHADSH